MFKTRFVINRREGKLSDTMGINLADYQWKEAEKHIVREVPERKIVLEDRGKVLDQMCKMLQMTRKYMRLAGLEYRKTKLGHMEITARFSDGSSRYLGISDGDAIDMIRYVLDRINIRNGGE